MVLKNRKILLVLVLLTFFAFAVPVAQAATTKTVVVTKAYYSLVGITVAKHYSTTWWTYDGIWLYSSPKGVDTDWWTAPLNYEKTYSQGWDWYTPGMYSWGRSFSKVSFVFGVPTPWGPVGSTYTSTIRTTVYYNGNWSCY